VRDDLPIPGCAQCGRPIFDTTSESGAHRMVYAAMDDPAEREAPEQEARSMRLVHSGCWPAYAEAHGIETD
jgi:hypothetical protein